MARNNIWGTSVVKSCLSQQVYNPQGMIDQGYRNSREALLIAENSGDIYSRAVAHTMYGFSCYLKGNWEEAERHLLLGIDLNERINFFLCHAFASLYLGNTYAEISEHQKAENYYIEQALDADSKNGTRWDLAIDYWRYGEWFMKTGQHPKARENLAKALDIFNTCGADGWAAKTGKQLAIIS